MRMTGERFTIFTTFENSFDLKFNFSQESWAKEVGQIQAKMGKDVMYHLLKCFEKIAGYSIHCHSPPEFGLICNHCCIKFRISTMA